jgi:hypothetical protein
VDNIKIGDRADKIYSALKSKYAIETADRSNHLKEIIVRKDKKMIMKVSLKDDSVFLIDVYALFSTSKDIHPGSTLSEVLEAYGKGEINPTDAGYYVYYDNMPGIQFLINNQDVPKKIRNIPDDIITGDQEKQILNLKAAKIAAIQIYCENKF